MVQAKAGDAVKVHYTGTLKDGSVFDSSRERELLEFTLGERSLLAGFEDAVVGMEPGESKTIKLSSDQAYGSHQSDRVIEVERSEMPSNLPLEVGVRVQATSPQGQLVQFTVIVINETSVTLDGNHPLAGQDLTFEIELVSIV